ncbi:MAG: response regulator, partial [Gemmatimonadaceae bacterium]|nr:response regulator [Gemmatimonadaceae bacterium]
MNRSPDNGGQPARILIVDDDRINRRLIEVMLAPEGFELQSASSGEEALVMVGDRAPDLVLLDIMMPGMDGYQFANELKGNVATKNIPIIMLSALNDRNSRMHGLNAGAEDFVTKPVDRAELTVRVRNLLRLKSYGDYHDKYSQLLENEVGSRTEDLNESMRLYRSTFDAAPVGIVHVGLDGRWLRVNRRLCELLGYTSEELQTSTVQAQVLSDDESRESESFQQMSSGILDRYLVQETRYRRRDGRSLWARVNTSVFRDTAGEPLYLIAVIEDVTEQRTLEAQVRQAGKMDAVGRLASGVAHDFNNLLTVILGFAQFAIEDVEADSELATDLGEIVTAAQRAAGLTRQLLAFGRQQVLHTESQDINALITEMTGMLRRLIGENIEIVHALAPDLSPALVDRGQFEQVVMNLVVNARDAMPDGGRVLMETRNVELENSAFHEVAVEPGPYVMLAITDTGSGMTKETQQRLFEPFFTTKDAGKGTGLGLSTTYGIVKQSNGYVWVYSELGLGTTFKVYLP